MKKENFKGFLFLGILIFVLFLNIGLAQAEENTTSTPDVVIPVVDVIDTASSTVDIVIPEVIITTTTSSSTVEVSTHSDFSVNLNIRYQDTFIFSGVVSTTPKETLSDSTGVTHLVSSSSTVLSALIDATSITSTFVISQLDYYDAYKSFYLNCLTLTAVSTTPICGNWNYVVNGGYPSVGLDSYQLFGGETIYLYFGDSWKITVSTSTFPIGTTTTLSTWRYNFDDLAEEWTPDNNDLIDISITNPNSLGWWDTTITTTTLTSDSSGLADYVFSSTGTYFAKITSADYSKWSQAVTLIVLDVPTSTTFVATSTMENYDGSATGGGEVQPGATSLISASEINSKVQQILNFLKSQQSDDGKIIDGGLTDWAIISFAANGEYAEDIKKGSKSLLNFARAYDFSDASDLNICASYPRHVLALLSGGISSSDEKIQSLVTKIKSQECYVNHQFGQNGINDDVFALLSLLAVNHNNTEPIITDLVENIIKDQTTEGAFTWAGYASPDVTGAALNALKYAFKKGVGIDSDVFVKAKKYLKNQQLSDGGWGFGQSDVLTTAWAVMGLNSLSEGQNEWANVDLKNPWSVLISQLNNSGYYEPVWAPGTIDWFAVKHAVPALLGKSWPIILQPRNQIVEASANPSDLINGGVGEDLIKIEISSSTPLITSSTLPQILEETSSPLVLATSSVSDLISVAPLLPSDSQLKENTNEIFIPSQSKITKNPSAIIVEVPKDAENIKIQTTPDQSSDPYLPLEKKVAETAAASSAVILASSTLLLLSRLLLAIL
ncbi:MAG: terpene cyclase/mutase family protein [Candidatus Magasanikbacteria bacterium]|nr:terpene cyclase/mutase family protein [Candidatus Magasanikbacteria bacterium]